MTSPDLPQTDTDEVRLEGMLDRLSMLRGWSRATRCSYRSDLLHAHRFFRQRHSDIFHASHDDVLDYLAALMREGMGQATIRRRRSALATWFSFLLEQGERNDHPAHHLPSMRKSRPLPKLMSERDVEALLNAPDVTQPTGLRDRCMLELLYATGLRVSELVGLRLASVDRAAGLLRVIGKGDKERLVPFGEEAAGWLDAWLEVRPRQPLSTFLFPGRQGRAMTRQNFWLRIRHYAQCAGIRPLPSPHTLRHAFATHLLGHGADLRVVQMLLGHANVTTTEIYTHVARARLHDLVNRNHPLGG